MPKKQGGYWVPISPTKGNLESAPELNGAFSTIPSLFPKIFLLCNIPVAVSGGYGALFMAASCYIVDITDCKTRAFSAGNFRKGWFGILSAPMAISRHEYCWIHCVISQLLVWSQLSKSLPSKDI
ncbi:hypothetical protein QTP88_000557 [Uroleucon formosanum]